MTLSNIPKAVAILKRGGLVAFPTETVYGLGADASNEFAVRRIFAAKNRPFHHPLIVHIPTVEDLHKWAVDIQPGVFKLAQAFWPGPLTMVLKRQPHVLDIVTGGQDTIGLRMPNHPVAQHLLQAAGIGLAAPSANQFTHISPTTAQAVYEELGDKVDLILDGGFCQVGLESTIIDMTSDLPAILRPGMISVEAINQVLGLEVICNSRNTQRAPGMHALHYAPTTNTMLIETKDILNTVNSLKAEDLPVAFLIRSDCAFPSSPHITRIQMPSEPSHFAQGLYHTLRKLDQEHYQSILIEAVPEGVDWDGIRDRIFKATASRCISKPIHKYK